MKTTLDRYSLLIISKYFDTCDDFINSMLTNKKFGYLVDMFHFNPISINNSSKKLFTNIETQHIYNQYDEIIRNLFNYIVWYPSDIKTIEYFDKKYHIRPIFKKHYVDYTFNLSGNKKEGDLLFYSERYKIFGREVQEKEEVLESVDFSEFVGIRKIFYNYPQIKEIKLGNHINTIPYNCFSRCPLNSIDLSNVTKIDEYVFSYCTNLTSITLSKHLEVMAINSFIGCSSLKSITISDNSKEFKLDLSYELYQIMKSNGITCTGNVWITNDEEITTDIGCKIIKTKELFDQEIVKFDSLQLIPSNVVSFYFLNYIKQIILSPNVVSINQSAFYNMKSLESINLGNVKQIYFYSFMNCIELKEVNISNLRYLGISAFEGCKNLSSVTYSTYLNKIPIYCFSCCPKLKEIKGIENVNYFGYDCFKNCNKLKFYELPKNLIRTSNGSRFNIKSIDKDCPIIRFERECFKGNTTLESIHIKKSNLMDKIIGYKAFSYCTSLKEVKLEEIRNLNDQAFKDCYSLSTIELPSSLKTIGNYCFENCLSLKEIQIPSNVHYIGKNAFANSKSLTKVEFGNGKVKISFDIFKHCPLKEINLINGNKMKGYFSYEHYLMLKLKGIDVKKVEYTRSDRRKYGNIIPECCCGIGEKAFEGCSMKELTIPSNIKSLGYKCFNNCRNLNKIYVRTELKNNIIIGVDNNYDLSRNESPFTFSIKFKTIARRNYRLRRNWETVLQEKNQKDETIPIEIIEIETIEI